MDLNDPETWRWIWLVAAFAFAIGEIMVAGSFFMAPFAVGAAVASVLGFAGVSVEVEWLAFVASSSGLFLAMRPIARRLDADGPQLGVGSHRQISQQGRVVEPIEGPHDSGFVMLGAERWRADSATGEAIGAGTTVTVVEVRGTRLVVVPTAEAAAAPPQPET